MDKEKSNNKEAEKSVSKHVPNIDDNRELRRSSRFPVKPRRYECEDLTSLVRNKNMLKANSKTVPECFESDTKCDEYVPRSSEEINLLKESTLRRSNRSRKPSPFHSDYIKSTPKTRRKKVEPDSKDKRDCFYSKTESDVKYACKLTSPWKKCQREENDDAVNQHESQSRKNHLIKDSNLKKSLVKITNEYNKNNLRNVKQIVYPTAEEIAENKRREREQIRVNRKMKAMLENLVQVPEKVSILSLNNMTSDEILNTLPKYKDQLDIIFRELRSKPRVDDYKGINHYSVIELIDDKKQQKMMQKLGEVYEAEQDGISLSPTLFANALMPQWLVHIFKDKYKFSHTEAVSHLKKQLQYMQCLDVDDYH